MIKLKEERGTLWEEVTVFCPYLLEYIQGDGEQLIWFEYMDDRPRYYVVRVDSSIPFGSEVTDENREALTEIIEATKDESQEYMSEEQLEDYSYQGYFNGDDRDWPIPPLEMADGWSFGYFKTEDMREQILSLLKDLSRKEKVK